MRRLLRKYRATKKIDKHTYHSFYMRSKGNQFKNKFVLVEAIHKAKSELKRGKDLTAQAEAKKGKKKVETQKEIPKEAPKETKKEDQKDKAGAKDKGKKKEKVKKTTEGKK